MPDAHVHKIFNLKKIAVLKTLAMNGPLTPQEIAARTGRYPIRSMYSYLRHLAKWKLVTRGQRPQPRGRMLYSLTERGSTRLAWLTRPSGKKLNGS